MKKWFFWMLLGSGLLFGGVFGFNAFKNKMIADYMANMPVPVIAVTAVTVNESDWQPEINSIGYVEPKNGVTINGQTAGVISELLIDSGQNVTQGDVMLRLDSKKEFADLKATQARIKAAKSERERLQKLVKKKLVTAEAADTADANYRSLLAQVDSLEATIARRTIIAPFDGVLGIVDLQIGQYVTGGEPLVRLENIDVMRIGFAVAERDFAQISVGMPVEIHVEAYPEQVFNGQINAIEPIIEKDSGMVDVQAVIPNEAQLLRSGMYGDIKIKQQVIKNQTIIPQDAVNFTLYGETVFLVNEEAGQKTAKMQVVKVKHRKGHMAWIESGLKKGDEIITTGQLKLANGTPIEIVKNNTLDNRDVIPRR